MAEAESKRQRRTPQERANELDEKITKIKQKIQEIVKLAMKNGMSVEEVASQLHVEVES